MVFTVLNIFNREGVKIYIPPTYIYVYICTYIGEGDDTPLQYSCLENPMDGGAW